VVRSIVLGLLHAFRVWGIDGDALRSPYIRKHLWMRGVNGPVGCELGYSDAGPLISTDHTGPIIGCECGIYADSVFTPFDRLAGGLLLGYGLVSVWGTVHLGYGGRELRAQFASLRALASPNDDDVVDAAARRLGVDVVKVGDLSAVAESAGRSIAELVEVPSRLAGSHRGWMWPEWIFHVIPVGTAKSPWPPTGTAAGRI
jgi:hypothetical protein